MSQIDADKYCLEINSGLEKTNTTTLDGIPISLNHGILRWITKAQEVKENGGVLFFCGNGASCTMAEHMSHDWFQNAQINTYTCSETAHITAVSNDLSYEDVFAYRIERIMTDKDILITISSSGNSPNVIRAITAAQQKGAFVVTLSGKSESNLSRKMGDLNFWVPLETYGLVESAHAVLLHCALDAYLDNYMGGRH